MENLEKLEDLKDLEILENFNQDDLIEDYSVDTTNKKTVKLLFISIVILGVIGMVCFAFAYIMGDTGIYHGASLEVAKSNFFRSQFYYSYISEANMAINDPELLTELFNVGTNSNLVGVTKTLRDFSDTSNNIVTTYGNVSPEDTFSYLHYRTYGANLYDLNIHILKDTPFVDEFKLLNNLISFLYNNVITVWLVGICVGIGIILLYFKLIKASGGNMMLSKFPLEINFICAMILGAVCCFSFSAGFVQIISPEYDFVIIFYVIYLLAFAGAEIVFLFLTLDIATRIKNKTLFNSTLLGMIFNSSVSFNKKIFSNCDVLWRFFIIYAGYALATVPMFTIFKYHNSSRFFYFILLNMVIFPFLIYTILNFSKLLKASKKIAEGDYDYKIDMKYMKYNFEEFATNLNNISAGMEIALQEKLKSEMLKTELITNVSHDIKTPLTSIINYSDLISKEECDNEKIHEYSDVLYRQSNKLKKLIDDLIDVSKASSGNINIELEDIKLDVFIEQVTGEYKEKLTDMGIQLIQKPIAEDIYIKADGKLLSRVFDNLFNNIIKYSLEGTRVYLDVDTNSKFTSIELKNTSKYQLNISQDLLTERFIRGDSSRHSEGSGLGLSIAQNLTTAQGAKFNIIIDGDLFKSTINFPHL